MLKNHEGLSMDVVFNCLDIYVYSMNRGKNLIENEAIAHSKIG